MREIKFRAFHNLKNRFIDIFDINCFWDVLTVWYSDLWEPWIDITNQIELNQYTWLKDKNGKEKYEWEIVEWNNTECWILESNIDTNVHICKIDWFMNWWTCRLNDEHCWFTLWSSHMTIIWNIYENPEIISNI